MTRPWPAAVTVVAILGPTLAGEWMAGARAQAGGFPASFSTTAAADGVRQSVIVPSAPLSDRVVDLGGPSVQAALDSLGASQAFASLPYPGETLATGSGLARTLSGAPVPDYPLYVRSSHPIVPRQEVSAGSYGITAQSTETASNATATGGLAAPGSAAVGLVRALASAEATAESVVATAESEVESFTVGPLRFGHVHSEATVRLDGDRGRSRRADTRIIAAAVGGTAVAVTPAGLALPGSSQPLPSLDPVRSALAAAGITVDVLPGSDHPTGVVAPTVRVIQHQPSGAEVISLLGGASAFIDSAAAPAPTVPTPASGGAVAPPDGDVAAPGPGRPGAPPNGGPVSGRVPVPATVGRRESPEGVAAGGLPPASAAPAPATMDGSAAGVPAAPTTLGTARRDPMAATRLASELLGLRADAGPLYAPLGIGALVALLAVGASRWRARRAR